ncbi:peroxiredoxin [Methanolacinia paynteri]|uniref:peroxiredoxin n=1 Tax=Methanolacinia paynteri TaxID=230356 RepID=UPI00064F2E2F|nr:peroxiredoxin [Methanolacinia paynteri]
MDLIAVGETAPPFCLPDSWHSEVCIEAFKGRWVVLYFYPKDNTTGCTLEAQTFSAGMNDFRGMNTIVIGISPDSCESHEKFVKKHSLDLILLSDETHVVLEKYGVWQKKKLYGREYFGVERTTYLINPEGVIVEVWPKVKVKGHAEEVKAKVVSLTGNNPE